MLTSQSTLDIVNKIDLYEKEGLFDQDIFDDPETIPLKPGEIDYLRKKKSSKLKTRIANFIAFHYFEKLIKKKEIYIKDITGIENFKKVTSGAVLTCNHFHPFDNYAIYHVIYKELHKQGKKDLWKVIREGNYHAFKGMLGFFFRNCNTLPLAADFHVMKDFIKSCDSLLNNGEKILIYPEQALWPNYRKPRPLKIGAFEIACRSNVPVIPFYIEMHSTDLKDKRGNYINSWTIHILEPIYPDLSLDKKDRAVDMMNKNYEALKNIYESSYHVRLTYKNERK